MHARSSSSMTVKMLAPWRCEHIFPFWDTWAAAANSSRKSYLAAWSRGRISDKIRCLHAEPLWEYPQIMWQSAFSQEASSAVRRSPAAFLLPWMESEKTNTHSLTRSTITVENVRKHQLQPITPPTCNIAVLADKVTCRKLVQQLRLNVYLSAGWVDWHSVVKCFPCSVQSENELLLNYDINLIGVLSLYIWVCVHIVAEMLKYTALREGDFFIYIYWGHERMKQSGVLVLFSTKSLRLYPF